MILETERLILDTWQSSDWTALRPIATDVEESRRLYEDALGIAFKKEDGDYRHTEELKGVNLTLTVGSLLHGETGEYCFDWVFGETRPHT